RRPRRDHGVPPAPAVHARLRGISCNGPRRVAVTPARFCSLARTGGPPMTLPLLALTLGDPAGIGPEIVVRSMADPEVRAAGRCLAVGDPAAVSRALEICDLDWSVHPVDEPDRAGFAEG